MQTELYRVYAQQVRQHLSFFPVWPPGDTVAPGDVGRLDGGVFHREATLADLIGSVDVQVAERTGLVNRFRSTDCTATDLRAKGGGTLQPGLTAQAEVTLRFANAGGTAFDAADCTERAVSNVLQLRSQIEAARDLWPAGYVLVTRVTVAGSYLVVIAGEDGASVELSGAADALGSWNLGHAAVGFSGGNQGGYQGSGSGPLLLGLYGFSWWGQKTHTGGMKPLALAAPEVHDFLEVPARNAAFD